MEIKRLHLASLRGPDGRDWPVHGFVIMHPAGPVLVDTGVGGPERVLTDWRVVNRSVAEALAEHDLAPVDISLVINTHLHFDHAGQNAVFSHAPCYVQRDELERSKREEPTSSDTRHDAGTAGSVPAAAGESAPTLRTVVIAAPAARQWWRRNARRWWRRSPAAAVG